MIAVLFLIVSFARAADDDEEKIPPLPKEVAEIARKYAGVTEWQGFFGSVSARALWQATGAPNVPVR